jgi:ATP-binding cassette subfamily C protein
MLNVLLLGGSIYMMLVYDSVIPSHSLPTLIGLLAMLLVVYAFQGLFDTMRSRILGDVAAGFDRHLAARVQRAALASSLRGGRSQSEGQLATRDLDAVRNFLASTGPAALIDLPWIVFFLGILFLLHVWLGVTALVGAIIMIGLTLLTDRQTRQFVAQGAQIATRRSTLTDANLRHAEVLTSLGMRERMLQRWVRANDANSAAQRDVARVTGTLGGISRLFRMLLQSLILTVGALLVIDGRASGGVIFASSILSGRALAPVDSVIGNWRGLAAARLGWRRLDNFLARNPDDLGERTRIPAPAAELEVANLVVAPPGGQQIAVQHASFRLTAGDGLGIIGPSAAGKTSLGRALIGAWPPLRGTVRLDGSTYDRWDVDTLGVSLGYLPQTVELLDGTVAENIARFDPHPDADAILAAARAAGVHDLVARLPQGYDTPVGMDGAQLSAGQRQRIGLARALYRDPFLVLLDEPNSNLDAEGEAALEAAIAAVRARGGIVVIIAHRPSVLSQVTHLLLMRDGRMEAFGPRDGVMAKVAIGRRGAVPVPVTQDVTAADAAERPAGDEPEQERPS